MVIALVMTVALATTADSASPVQLVLAGQETYVLEGGILGVLDLSLGVPPWLAQILDGRGVRIYEVVSPQPSRSANVVELLKKNPDVGPVVPTPPGAAPDAEHDRLALAVLAGRRPDPGSVAPTPTGALTRKYGWSKAPVVVDQWEHPRWARAGAITCLDGDKQVFWGVGVASGIRDRALARTTADNRARAEIGKLSGAVTIERTVLPDGSVKTVTTTTGVLAGVTIIDHAFKDQTVWALASMDAPPEASAEAKPCPSGTEVAQRWALNGLDAEGRPGSPRPAWAQDLRPLEDAFETVTHTASTQPLDTGIATLGDTLRGRWRDALRRAGVGSTGGDGGDPMRRCLDAIPWEEALTEAELDLWFDAEKGDLWARLGIAPTDLATLLPAGCSTEAMVAAIRPNVIAPPAKTLSPVVQDQSPVEPSPSIPPQPPPQPPVPVPPPPEVVPGWVTAGSGPALNDGRRVIRGVGSAAKSAGGSVTTRAATEAARGQAVAIAERWLVESLMVVSERGGRPAPTKVTRAIINDTVPLLSAGTVWVARDGTVWVMVELGLGDISPAVARVKGLRAAAREDLLLELQQRHERELSALPSR